MTANRRKEQSAQREQRFAVRGEYITLGQLLKMTGIIETGGAAKSYLSETMVRVNGEPESRRGRKLRPGDRVVAPGAPALYLVAGEEGDAEEEEGDAEEAVVEEGAA